MEKYDMAYGHRLLTAATQRSNWLGFCRYNFDLFGHHSPYDWVARGVRTRADYNSQVDCPRIRQKIDDAFRFSRGLRSRRRDGSKQRRIRGGHYVPRKFRQGSKRSLRYVT